MTENVIIIPTRLEATRLPNKPIKKINNKVIETIFITKENPIQKILKLPELIFKINRYLKKTQKKIDL